MFFGCVLLFVLFCVLFVFLLFFPLHFVCFLEGRFWFEAFVTFQSTSAMPTSGLG